MKKTLGIIGNVLLWLFVAFAAVMTILVFSAQGSKDGLASVFGKSMVTIISPSMSPTLKKGDLILTKKLTDDEKTTLKTGDIITFYTDLNGDGTDEINTHRIVEVINENGAVSYITKGDNKETNPVNDKEPTPAAKVLAKYTNQKLPGVGNVIGFLQTSVGFLCVIVIPLVLFFLYELYHFIATLIHIRADGKISPEDEAEIKRRAVAEYLREQQAKAAENDAAATTEDSSEK